MALDQAYTGSSRLLVSTLGPKLIAYGRDASKLGTVDQLVTNMFSGQAEFAVLSFGGFLGLGQKYHPVPFSYLRLSTDGAGYIVDLDDALIGGSPSYRSDDAPSFDEAYGQRIKAYYSNINTAS